MHCKKTHLLYHHHHHHHHKDKGFFLCSPRSIGGIAPVVPRLYVEVSFHLHALAVLYLVTNTRTIWVGGRVGRKTHQDTVEKRGVLPFLGNEPRSFGCPARSLVNVLTTLNLSCVVCCFCSHVHAVLVALSLEVKRPGCEANQSSN